MGSSRRRRRTRGPARNRGARLTSASTSTSLLTQHGQRRRGWKRPLLAKSDGEKSYVARLRGLPKQARCPSCISKRDQASLVDKKGAEETLRFRIGPPRFWVGPSFDYYRPGPPRRCSYDQLGRGGLLAYMPILPTACIAAQERAQLLQHSPALSMWHLRPTGPGDMRVQTRSAHACSVHVRSAHARSAHALRQSAALRRSALRRSVLRRSARRKSARRK